MPDQTQAACDVGRTRQWLRQWPRQQPTTCLLCHSLTTPTASVVTCTSVVDCTYRTNNLCRLQIQVLFGWICPALSPTTDASTPNAACKQTAKPIIQQQHGQAATTASRWFRKQEHSQGLLCCLVEQQQAAAQCLRSPHISMSSTDGCRVTPSGNC